MGNKDKMNAIECKVVMLPQDKEGWNKGDITLCVDSIMSGSDKIGTIDIPAYDYTAANPYHEAQHLYFTSDEEIKDWYIDDANLIRKSITNDKDYWAVRKSYKRIVASTDPSLGLPQIPEEWIRTKYVPSNGSITDVKLEMIQISPAQEKWSMGWEYTPAKWGLKLTANNEVVIA